MTRLIAIASTLFNLLTLLCMIGAMAYGVLRHGDVLAYASGTESSTASLYLLDLTTRQVISVASTWRTVYPMDWNAAGQLLYDGQAENNHLLGWTEMNGTATLFDPEMALYINPVWSPDGRLTLSADPDHDGDRDIYLIAMDTGEMENLTHTILPRWDTAPAWSSDGRLAFASSDGDTPYEIVVLNVETGQQINVTQSPSNDHNPAWSTDGRLAFMSDRDGNWEIYLVDLATGEQTNLTRNPRQDLMPAWTPNGQLSFVSDRSGNAEIYLLTLESSALENITQSDVWDGTPIWMP